MAQPIQITVVLLLFFTVSFWWNHHFHSSGNGIGNDFIGIMPPISQQCFGRYALNQMDSFFALSSGTLCNKYSDRQTICIHGKMNFGIEPPFVRLISWFPPLAPAA